MPTVDVTKLWLDMMRASRPGYGSGSEYHEAQKRYSAIAKRKDTLDITHLWNVLVHAESDVRFVVNKRAWQEIHPALSVPTPTASDDEESDDDALEAASSSASVASVDDDQLQLLT